MRESSCNSLDFFQLPLFVEHIARLDAGIAGWMTFCKRQEFFGQVVLLLRKIFLCFLLAYGRSINPLKFILLPVFRWLFGLRICRVG